MADSKVSVFRATAHLARHSHDVYCVDLSHPHTSPDTYNPLDYIASCARSSDPQAQGWAQEEIRELTRAIVPPDHKSPFWQISSCAFLDGVIQCLLDLSQDRQVALSTIMKELASFLPWGLAQQNLECYTNAAKETAASIYSIASSALSTLAASRGMMDLLSNNSLSISALDGTQRPFLVYMILSDQSQVYNTVAAILVSHLLRQADRRGGALERQVSFILEELGTVGRAIPGLPQLMSQCLGRKIRVTLILQSMS